MEINKPGYNLVADIINIMAECNITFKISPNNKWSPPLIYGFEWPIENIIAPNTLYKKHRTALKKENLLYLEQLIDRNKLVT